MKNNCRAYALPLVIWGILIASFAVVGAILTIEGRLTEESLSSRIGRARELAMTGVAFALHPAVTYYDPLLSRQISNVEAYDVALTPEGGRCPINSVLAGSDLTPLMNLFLLWGADSALAKQVADALADWVDTDENRRPGGAESTDYIALGQPGLPLNRPFQTFDEMAAVMGMDQIEQLKPNWRDYFTLWGPELMDIHSAPIELIAAFGNIPLETAETLSRLRGGSDGLLNTDDDPRFTSLEQLGQLMDLTAEQIQKLSLWFGIENNIVRIVSRAQVANLEKTILVIANKPTDGQSASTILLWQEL